MLEPVQQKAIDHLRCIAHKKKVVSWDKSRLEAPLRLFFLLEMFRCFVIPPLLQPHL